MFRIVRSSAVALFAVVSILPAWAAFIKGQVKLKNGEPAARVVVRLRSDVVAYQDELQTDPDGKFEFQGIPLTAYHLWIEGQGFKTYNSYIDVSTSQMAYELITLLPDKEEPAKAVPPEGPAGTIDAHLAQTPPNALKEYNLAQKLMQEKKDAAGSTKHLLKAIKLYEDFSEAYLMLGLIYYDQQKFGDSQTALQKSVKLNPKSAEGFSALGAVLNQQAKYKDAEAALAEGLQLKPDDATAQCELARAYWAMGKWQEAEPHARKAVAFMPDLAPAHILLGNVALRKNDKAAALKEFEEYLRLDPKGAMADPARQVVAQIQGESKSHSQRQ